MSDPRMIPAAEAKRLREAATPGPWHVVEIEEGRYLLLGSNPDRPFTFPHLAKMEEAGDADLARLAPDLAHTVVGQDETIQTLSRLLAGAEESATERAAQIERVREVLAWAEHAENRAHHDWIRTADTHHRDAALACTQVVTWLRYALGDNDE